MSTYTIAIICPHCGGNVSLAEGTRVLHCRFCDRKSLASSSLGYPTLYLPPKISAQDARLIAEKYVPPEFQEDVNSLTSYFLGQQDAPSLSQEYEVKFFPLTFHQTQLLYVPFWRAQARMIGWVSGQAPFKEETIEEFVEDGEGRGSLRKKILHSGGEPLKRMLVLMQEYTFPAAEVKELGVLRLTWEAKSLNFLPVKSNQSNHQGYWIDPSISLFKARREAEALFMKRVLAPYKHYTDFFHHLKLLPPQLTLFYYPFWLLTAVPHGNFNRRILDAVEGKVILADTVYPES